MCGLLIWITTIRDKCGNLAYTLSKTGSDSVNNQKQNLRLPGPVSCPSEILEALSSPMINHRGTEFKDMLFRTTEGLKSVFGTKDSVYILTGSLFFIHSSDSSLGLYFAGSALE